MAYIAGEKIVTKEMETKSQLSLEGIKTDLTNVDLCRWLDRKQHQSDIKQEVMLEFLRRVVRDLLARDDLDMPKLVRGKFILEKVLQDKNASHRNDAYKKGYQTCMFGEDAIATVEPKRFSFTFGADYPANLLYEGSISFTKHYYPRIGIMNKKKWSVREL